MKDMHTTTKEIKNLCLPDTLPNCPIYRDK